MLKRLAAILVTVLSLLFYGASFFINSITSQFLGPSQWAQTLFLVTASRAMISFLLLPVLYLTENTPKFNDVSNEILFSKQICLPFLNAVISNLAYVCYLFLVLSNGMVSIYSVLVGLYGIFPVIYGLLYKKEKLTWFKGAGIVCYLVATLIIGFSGGLSSTSDGGTSMVAVRIALLLGAIVGWGTADILSSEIKLDSFSVTVSSLLGLLLFALVSSFLLTYSQQISPISFGFGQGIIFIANVLAVGAWYGFVALGKLDQEVSVFAPILNLYLFVSVILAAIFLREAPTVFQSLGIVIAFLAIVLLSFSDVDFKSVRELCSPNTHNTSATTADRTNDVEHPKTPLAAGDSMKDVDITDPKAV
jgi:drug/metabolite transporter (DMT)-like permease